MTVYTGTIKETEKCIVEYLLSTGLLKKGNERQLNYIWDNAGNSINTPDGSTIYITEPFNKQIIIVTGKANEYFKTMEVIKWRKWYIYQRKTFLI